MSGRAVKLEDNSWSRFLRFYNIYSSGLIDRWTVSVRDWTIFEWLNFRWVYNIKVGRRLYRYRLWTEPMFVGAFHSCHIISADDWRIAIIVRIWYILDRLKFFSNIVCVYIWLRTRHGIGVCTAKSPRPGWVEFPLITWPVHDLHDIHYTQIQLRYCVLFLTNWLFLIHIKYFFRCRAYYLVSTVLWWDI